MVGTLRSDLHPNVAKADIQETTTLQTLACNVLTLTAVQSLQQTQRIYRHLFLANKNGYDNCAAVISLVTFLLGVTALLVWLHVLRFNPSTRTIMLSGLWYAFLASALLGLAVFFTAMVVRDPDATAFLSIIILAPLIEECIKVRAANSLDKSTQIFALISLLGIYELMLSKPLSMLDATHWSQALIGIPAVMMHMLTAAIYAFHFEGSRKEQFTISAAIHIVFNAIVLIAAGFSAFPLILVVVLIALVVAIYLLTPNAVREAAWQPTEKFGN